MLSCCGKFRNVDLSFQSMHTHLLQTGSVSTCWFAFCQQNTLPVATESTLPFGQMLRRADSSMGSATLHLPGLSTARDSFIQKAVLGSPWWSRG